jgi:hypothetical protein
MTPRQLRIPTVVTVAIPTGSHLDAEFGERGVDPGSR